MKMNNRNSRMYDNTKTWNPSVGCCYNCIYCEPSFQAQLKRRKRACLDCYEYTPHTHKERLKRIPSAEIVFVSGCGDISFCSPGYTRQIIDRIKEHNPDIKLIVSLYFNCYTRNICLPIIDTFCYL